MALLVVRYAEELGYIQNFTVEEYGHRSSTLYYKSYGPSRLIGGHYKIVTYLSLEEYNKKYETLRGEYLISIWHVKMNRKYRYVLIIKMSYPFV